LTPGRSIVLPGSLGQLSLLSLRVGKSSTRPRAGVRAGRVHLCRVALRDPIWQVTPLSSVMGIPLRAMRDFNRLNRLLYTTTKR